MSLTEFNQDLYDKCRRQEGFEEGLEAGRVQGAQQNAIEAAINLLKMNILTPEQIAKAQQIPLERVLELQKEIAVKV